MAQGYALVPAYTDEDPDLLFSSIEDKRLEGCGCQYKSPALIRTSISKHSEQIEAGHPVLHEKIKKPNEMTLNTTF